MRIPPHFRLTEHFAVYRPEGEASFEEGIELFGNAIAFARENRIRRLILDTTGLRGFFPRSVIDCFRMNERWAGEAGARVVVAIVTGADSADFDGFGVTVARNRGMLTSVFRSEPEAIEWLLGENAT
jgi:hypothetical protein